jgi:glycosyltransferase involved in cell wall biosynthesis
MHTLLIADGRSPITKNWLRMLAGLNWHVSLVSTFLCDPPEGAQLLEVLPVGFSTLAGGQVHSPLPHAQKSIKPEQTGWKRTLLNRSRPLLRAVRARLGPLTLGKYQRRLVEICADIRPDLAHALRIPFEGMLAATLPGHVPLLVSIWGNDLTLHARSSAQMASLTRLVLKRADALLADAARDVRLAADWGLRADVPRLVAPGNGGLDFSQIHATLKNRQAHLPFDLPPGRPIVVNPRGFRPGSVHQDTFFRSIPLVLRNIPDAFFVCTAMRGQPQAEGWVERLNLQPHVLLLPYLTQEELWQLFEKSNVYLSLSSHDGIPNTFLEALACGCFPVAGDIESLREWIINGQNGLLVNPRDEEESAKAITRALQDDNLTEQAKRNNQELVQERADMQTVREQFSVFITQFMEKRDLPTDQ